MNLHINGQPHEFPDSLSLASLVATLGMKSDRVAVELNLEIIPRASWGSTILKDGDRLEIVHFVGGGSASDLGPAAKMQREVEADALSTRAWTCPTCNGEALGNFCSNCGEKKSGSEDLSLRHFFSRTLEAFFHADAKIFRSFRALFAMPGLLTAEYVRGRRKPYLHPLQLFLVSNLIYFVLQPLTHWTGLRTPLYVHTNAMFYRRLASRMVSHHLAAHGMAFTDFRNAFDHAVDLDSRSLVLLMVPMFAVVVWILEWRKRRLFGEHLAFSLNFYAFWLLTVFLLLFGLSNPVLSLLRRQGTAFTESGVNVFLERISYGIEFVYLLFATRLFYRDKLLVAAGKAIVLVAATKAILESWRFVLFVTALYSV